MEWGKLRSAIEARRDAMRPILSTGARLLSATRLRPDVYRFHFVAVVPTRSPRSGKSRQPPHDASPAVVQPIHRRSHSRDPDSL